MRDDHVHHGGRPVGPQVALPLLEVDPEAEQEQRGADHGPHGPGPPDRGDDRRQPREPVGRRQPVQVAEEVRVDPGLPAQPPLEPAGQPLRVQVVAEAVVVRGPVLPGPARQGPQQRPQGAFRVVRSAPAEQLVELVVRGQPPGRGDLEGGQGQVVPVGVDGVDARRVGGQQTGHPAAGPADRQHPRPPVESQDAIVDLRVLVQQGEGEEVPEGRGERAIGDPLQSIGHRAMPRSSSAKRVTHPSISAPDHRRWLGEYSQSKRATPATIEHST